MIWVMRISWGEVLAWWSSVALCVGFFVVAYLHGFVSYGSEHLIATILA